jgi:hypothetical protein
MLALLALLALCFARSDALSHAMLTWRLRGARARRSRRCTAPARRRRRRRRRRATPPRARRRAPPSTPAASSRRYDPRPRLRARFANALACHSRGHAPLRSALCAGQGEARGVFNWTKSNTLNLTRAECITGRQGLHQGDGGRHGARRQRARGLHRRVRQGTSFSHRASLALSRFALVPLLRRAPPARHARRRRRRARASAWAPPASTSRHAKRIAKLRKHLLPYLNC